MNALQELSILPNRKEEVKEFARQGIEQILNGEYSALEFKVRADFIKKTLDKILDHAAVQDLVLIEAKKYEGQEYAGGIIKTQSRRTYDFTGCNSAEWNQLKVAEKHIKEQLSLVENMLKNLTAPVGDPVTGEIINPALEKITEFVTIK